MFPALLLSLISYSINLDGIVVQYQVMLGANAELASSQNEAAIPLKLKSFIVPDTLKSSEGVTYNIIRIGNYAFYKSSLEKVTLPRTIKEIGKYAFSDCEMLKTINLQDTKITTIDEYAFSDCFSLLKINLPDTLVTIQKMGFQNSHLTEIRISENIQEFGTSAFAYTQIKTIDLSHTKITKIPDEFMRSNFELQDVFLPEDVIEIGAWAFYECPLLSIKLSNNLQRIGSYSFSKTSIKIIDFSQTKITQISDYSFEGTLNLKTIVLNQQITSIQEAAFSNSGIETYIIPSSVTHMGEKAFSKCKMLDVLDFSKSGLLEIPNSVLEDSGVSKVILSENINAIGTGAFSGCALLKSINLKDTNIVSLGEGCFYKCEQLSSFELPSTLSRIGSKSFLESHISSFIGQSNLISIGEQSFANCNFLDKVDLSATKITEIPARAFEGCEMLSKFSWPQNLVSIGESAFSRTAIYSLQATSSITDINQYAFEGCLELSEVDLSDTKLTEIKIGTFLGCQSLSKIDLPQGLTDIRESAFKDTALTSISLPNIKNLESSAFENSKLKEIDLSNLKLTDLSKALFKNCTSLKTIKMPTTLEVIEDEALMNCPINSFTFEGIAIIGESAFEGTDLEEADLKDLQSPNISKRLFAGSKLHKFVFPSLSNRICKEAFERTLLEVVEVPSSINFIEEGAFRECPSLTKIDIQHTTVIPAYMCYKCVSLATLKLPSQLEQIGKSAFEGTSLSYFIGSSYLKSIGKRAFCNTKLQSADLSATKISKLRKEMFRDCTDLISFEFPEKTPVIEDGCFRNTGFKEFMLNIAVTKLGAEVFMNCRNLIYIGFTEAVVGVGARFLAGCPSLQKVDMYRTQVLTLPEESFMNSTTKELKLPKNLARLDDRCFAGFSFRQINIPDTVTTLTGAPFNQSIIRYLDLSQTRIKRLTEKVFYTGNNNIMEVTFPLGLIEIKMRGLSECSIRSIVLYDMVKGFDIEAFKDSKLLETVDISATNIRGIPSRTFYGCDVLREVKLPSKAIGIGESAFEYTALVTIELPEVLYGIKNRAFAHSSIRNISFANTKVTRITESAFEGCAFLENVDFGNVKEIQLKAFAETGIKEIVIPNANEIQESAFEHCRSTTVVDLTGSTISKLYRAFNGCSNLQKLILPTSIASIVECFHSTHKLTEIYCCRSSDIEFENTGFSPNARAFVSDNYNNDTFAGITAVKTADCTGKIVPPTPQYSDPENEDDDQGISLNATIYLCVSIICGLIVVVSSVVIAYAVIRGAHRGKLRSRRAKQPRGSISTQSILKKTDGDYSYVI